MYSLVLMTAFTTAPDGPEFNGFFRNLFHGGGCSGSSSASPGCSGTGSGSYAPRYSCYGSGSSFDYNGSCTGSGYPAGCTGSSSNSNSNGCTGGGFGSRVRRFFGHDNGCSGSSSNSPNGCSGSGYSNGCSGSGYGCSGSGYGCSGASAYSCFGGPAVSYTPVFNGGASCYGGPAFPAPPPMFNTFPTTPMTPGGPPATIPYAPPEAAPGTNPQNTGLRPAVYNTSALVSNSNPGARATVVVRLPQDARLFVDTKQLALTGAERKFVSPELPGGQEFAYRFRVEYERDGETVSVTKKVPVKAGAAVAVEFADLTAKTFPEKNAGGPGTGGNEPKTVAATPASNPATTGLVTSVSPVAPAVPTSPASDRATITVKMPAGASLYVDDRKSPSNEAVRQFSTPPLPGGREFAYLIRAEIVRNGQTETFTQKVPFRAGERVEVDFSTIGR